jgi:hypothetical protein
LDAWDSVVGHHQGLGAAHRTFRRTFKASSDEEVHELFRNGIVHGNLTNYDNKIVATKAWNRLFAVADWARAETRRIAPKPEPPTWRGLAADLAESARTKAAVEAFEPRTLTAADDEHFSSNDAYAACVVFLCAWQRTNFGAIAKVLASLIAKSYGSRAPRMVREEYTGFTLTDYSIMSLDFVAAAVCIISVSVTVNGEQRQAKLRWVREAEDGDIAPVGLPGEWRLISWGPYAILRDA